MYTVEGQSRALSCDVQTFSPVQPLSLLSSSSVPPPSSLVLSPLSTIGNTASGSSHTTIQRAYVT